MFNDPDRLISSTKRVGKNVEMSVSEKGGEIVELFQKWKTDQTYTVDERVFLVCRVRSFY